MNVLKYILTRSLPKTGQSYVYSAGDDGTYQAGWWRNRSVLTNKTRFKDNGNGTISDKATGLMWEKFPLDVDRLLPEGITYANNLTLAGYTDWRVPNINELLSLVNYGAFDGSIYPPFFDEIESVKYLSSTTYFDNYEYIWEVSFLDGKAFPVERDVALYIICVRTI